MTNSKATKRALISSALAILMCVAMLIGTTFAWFTDTASTGVNKIQSGKLDVALEMSTDGVNWESAEGKTLTFKTKDNRAADKILWEPGCTYELPQLRVVNNGNLALKYKIQITGIQGDAKLNDVIDWTIPVVFYIGKNLKNVKVYHNTTELIPNYGGEDWEAVYNLFYCCFYLADFIIKFTY